MSPLRAERTIAHLAFVLALGVVPSVGAAACPETVDESAFSSAAELRELTSEMAGFGLRSTASRSHKKFIRSLQKKMRQIDGMHVRKDTFPIQAWEPRPHADGVPGRDLTRAGGLRVTEPNFEDVPVAGAVPYALPTSKEGSQGPLVYLPRDQAITPESAAGRVVIRDFPAGSIPYIGFQIVGIYLTPDLAGRTGL